MIPTTLLALSLITEFAILDAVSVRLLPTDCSHEVWRIRSSKKNSAVAEIVTLCCASQIFCFQLLTFCVKEYPMDSVL